MADIPEKTPYIIKIIKANEYMVNKSDFLLCCITHNWGGVSKTYNYAKCKKI